MTDKRDLRDQLVTDVTSEDFDLTKPTFSDCNLLGLLYFDPYLRDDVLRGGRTFSGEGWAVRQTQVDRLANLYQRARDRGYELRECLWAHEMTVSLIFFSVAYAGGEISEIDKQWRLVKWRFESPTSSTKDWISESVSFFATNAYQWLDLCERLGSEEGTLRYETASRQTWPETQSWDLTRFGTDAENTVFDLFESLGEF